MNNIFGSEFDRFVLICLDNILLYRSLINDHVDQLHTIFENLHVSEIHAKKNMYKFGIPHVEYIGHIYGTTKVKTD